MKWTNTPDTHLLESYCEAKDGTNLGWVIELFDIDYNTSYEALICNGYEAATLLGHYKTPRLAQQAVERELIKRWFKYEWTTAPNCNTLYTNNGSDWLSFYDSCMNAKEKRECLARAKREFLNEL